MQSNQRPAPQAPPAPPIVLLRIGVAILLGIHGLSLVVLFLPYGPHSDLAGGKPVA